MAYDEKLEARVRAFLEGEQVPYETKHMFGGVCFLVAGKMALGIVKDDLMVRVGVEAYEDALESPHSREMDFTGKPLHGMVYVSPGGLTQHAGLARWLNAGITTAKRESAKSKPAARSKPAKSKPAKSKPAKSKPAKSKPAKSKPAKSKPAPAATSKRPRQS